MIGIRFEPRSLLISFGFAAVLAAAPAVSAFASPELPAINTNNVITVTNAPYGAVGDGVVDNATAIQQAIGAAAAGPTVNGLSGGTVRIPAPGTYLCGPLTLANNVNLQIDGGATLLMQPITAYPGGTTSPPNFLQGSSLHDVELSGSGIINGQGLPWWQTIETNSAAKRPNMINLSTCRRVLVSGLTLSNSPSQFLVVKGRAGDVTIRGVTILAPSSSASPPSHNTDGIDLAETNAVIQDCHISTGDDNIAIGSSASASVDILVTNCFFGDGHGVSIGSHTSGGVSNLLVINCDFSGTDNGIRLKSERDRGGLVQNLSYMNLGMTNVAWPFLIYSYYEYGLGTITGVTPAFAAGVSGLGSENPIWRDITFSNITATSTSTRPPLMIWGMPELMVSNVVFSHVSLTSSSYRSPGIYNADGVEFVDSQFNLSSAPSTFLLYDARIVVTNSAVSANPILLDGLSTNGVANDVSLYNATASVSHTNVLAGAPLTLGGGTLVINSDLQRDASAPVNFVLGTNNSVITVAGNLALSGTVNVSAGAGFRGGSYTLLTYGGTLNWGSPSLQSAPAGYNFTWDTATTGQVNLDVQPPAPARPIGLSASATNSLVVLSWEPSATATSYVVKRGTVSGGAYDTVFHGVTDTNYSDTLVTNGVTYYYVVSAVNAGGESTNSDPVSATPTGSLGSVVSASVFNEAFASSTLNSSSPESPAATFTSYELMSSKNWNPTPAISPGHLIFGIGPTTSGSIEAQGLFSLSPLPLATVGDHISLTVTFTNTSGLLTQAGAMGFGLYNSGQAFPVPGGLEATAVSSLSDHATGNAQGWMGYVGQVSFTGGSSRIMTRFPQTGTGNNNQDLVTSGSGSASYGSPAATTVGDASSAASVTLTPGAPYTEVLTITRSGANTLGITNALYSGTNTNGVLLSLVGAPASGATYVTNAFDALAVGWRATANTDPTAIDINQIKVDYTHTVTQVQPSMTPPQLMWQTSGNEVQLSWAPDHIGWKLQVQTNDLQSGLGTNWVTVPSSAATNEFTLPRVSTNAAVFLRLISP